jgi:O-antigen/teichoic acid export membrane protein
VKELGTWQLISFISRGMAMVLGLVQSFVIIRVLSVSEWGLVQLAASIGGALGIYQHLGLASASTREIASAKKDTDVFKIFLTSAVIRYLITIPLAVGLYIFAENIAVGLYKTSSIIVPLKIYAITMIFSGIQSILNSVISGTKRFKRLFIYQVAASVISAVLFIPLVYFYKISGYFYAYLAFNIFNSICLGFLALWPLRGNFQFPSTSDFKMLFKDIFSISLAIYLVKILATNWEKLGTNVLGFYSQPETIAIFAFAMLYAKKILSISDAVTDVSLPVLSEKYSNDIADFKSSFKKNFDRIFGFIILASAVACFWAPQLIALLVGGQKYEQSYVYIPAVLLAFVVYSILDIVKSSVYVPAKMVSQMITTYFLLIISTLVAFYLGSFYVDQLTSMSLALASGAVLSLIYVMVSVVKKLNLHFFRSSHWLLLFQATLIGWFGVTSTTTVKLLTFPPVLILLVVALFASKIFDRKEILQWRKAKLKA